MNSKVIIILSIIAIAVVIIYFISTMGANRSKAAVVDIQIGDKTYKVDKNKKVNDSNEPEKPIPFGYKSAWIAIKSSNQEAVIKFLGLTNTREANWSAGLKAANDINGEVFVTKPLDGWVLVIGLSLPDSGDSERPDEITPIIKKLSKEFGEAQFFASHRVVDYYAWAKAIDGEIARAYAYIGERGETAWNFGEKTQEEITLGFNFFDENSPETSSDEYWERTDLTYADEESVLQISKLWSIDTTFESKNYPLENGIIGKLTTR